MSVTSLSHILRLFVLTVFAASLLALSVCVAWFVMAVHGILTLATAAATFLKNCTRQPMSAETRFIQHEQVNDKVDNKGMAFHNKVDLEDLQCCMHCSALKEHGFAADSPHRVNDAHVPFTGPQNLVLFPATPVNSSFSDPPDEHCKFPEMRLERRRRASFPDTMNASELSAQGYFYHRECKATVCYHCGEKHGHAHGPRCNRHRCNVPEEHLNLQNPSLRDLHVHPRTRRSQQVETNQNIDVDLRHRQETNRNTDVHTANHDANSEFYMNLDDLGKEMNIQTRDPRQRRLRRSPSNRTTSDPPTSLQLYSRQNRSTMSAVEFVSTIQGRAESSSPAHDDVPTHQGFEGPTEHANPLAYSTFNQNGIPPNATHSDMSNNTPCSCNGTPTDIGQGRGNSHFSATHDHFIDCQQSFSLDQRQACLANNKPCVTSGQTQERTDHPSSCININPFCDTQWVPQSHPPGLGLVLTGCVQNTDIQSSHNPELADSGGGASQHGGCGSGTPADGRQNRTTRGDQSESSQPFFSLVSALTKRQNGVTVVAQHTDQETQGAGFLQSPQNVSECTVSNQPKKRCPKCGPVSNPQAACAKCPICGLDKI